jgi:hypothetical protein
MKTYGRMEIGTVLDLGTTRKPVVSFTLQPHYPKEKRSPGTHCIEGWINLRVCIDTVEINRNPIPRSSNPYLVATLTVLYKVPS